MYDRHDARALLDTDLVLLQAKATQPADAGLGAFMTYHVKALKKSKGACQTYGGSAGTKHDCRRSGLRELS